MLQNAQSPTQSEEAANCSETEADQQLIREKLDDVMKLHDFCDELDAADLMLENCAQNSWQPDSENVHVIVPPPLLQSSPKKGPMTSSLYNNSVTSEAIPSPIKDRDSQIPRYSRSRISGQPFATKYSGNQLTGNSSEISEEIQGFDKIHQFDLEQRQTTVPYRSAKSISPSEASSKTVAKSESQKTKPKVKPKPKIARSVVSTLN